MSRRSNCCEDVSGETAILGNLAGKEREAPLLSPGHMEHALLCWYAMQVCRRAHEPARVRERYACASASARGGRRHCWRMPRWSAVPLRSVALRCVICGATKETKGKGERKARWPTLAPKPGKGHLGPPAGTRNRNGPNPRGAAEAEQPLG